MDGETRTMFKWLRKKGHGIDKNSNLDAYNEGALFSNEEEIVYRPGKKILVVEDNERDAKLLVTLLEYHDHDIRHIGEGHKVMSLMSQFQPDLIVMNLPLPDVTGSEVTEWTMQDGILNKIPVIAITAISGEEHAKEYGNAKFQNVFTKPITVATLVAAIDKL